MDAALVCGSMDGTDGWMNGCMHEQAARVRERIRGKVAVGVRLRVCPVSRSVA